MRKLGFSLVIVALMTLIVVTDNKLHTVPREDPLGRRLLYLPSVEAVKLLSLGNRGLAADLIYIWSIQYYTFFSYGEQFLYLENVLDLITDLDPLYYDAYAIGGMIMGAAASLEPSRVKSLVALYDKGIANMPDDYALAEWAAWDFYTLFKDHDMAVRYAEIAASRPNAPNRLLRLAGRWRDKDHMWSFEESIKYWQQALAEAPSLWDRNYCRSHMYNVYTERDRLVLEPILQTYEALHGSCPVSWQPFLDRGVLREVPVDAMGDPYGINREKCTLWPRRAIRGD